MSKGACYGMLLPAHQHAAHGTLHCYAGAYILWPAAACSHRACEVLPIGEWCYEVRSCATWA